MSTIENLLIIIGLYMELINSVNILKNTDLSLKMALTRAMSLISLPPKTIVFSAGEESEDL